MQASHTRIVIDILDETWLSNYDLQLFSDSSGLAENGCSGYFMGRWFFLQWPKEWENTDISKCKQATQGL
jgi:hypothetical protein